jgi:uncharacterized membrane protein
MTFKEWTAVIQIAGVILIGLWLWRDFSTDPAAFATVNATASRLVWLILAVIVFNIVATIVVAILVSIAQGRALKDEAADERDDWVAARASRNGYVVTSLGAAVALVTLAFGTDPVLAAFALFGAPMLGGLTDAVSRLAYYRLG